MALLISAQMMPQGGSAPDSPGVLARTRWYWIPPLYALAMMFLLLLTTTQGGGAAQLMYRGF